MYKKGKQANCNQCIQYTALGNSIAFGEGASNNYGYVNYFRDFLAAKHSCVELNNCGDSGFSSSDLLNQLQHDETTQEAVKNANIITISIGGGNLLDCLTSDDFITCLVNAVVAFCREWPRILNEIRKKIKSNAKILVMTVFNPLRGDDPNFNFAELFIQVLNYIIKDQNNPSRFHYQVVDVHDDFKGQFTDGRWKVCTWTHFCDNPLDPHPTDSGHLEIARLHELVLLRDKHFVDEDED